MSDKDNDDASASAWAEYAIGYGERTAKQRAAEIARQDAIRADAVAREDAVRADYYARIEAADRRRTVACCAAELLGKLGGPTTPEDAVSIARLILAEIDRTEPSK